MSVGAEPAADKPAEGKGAPPAGEEKVGLLSWLFFLWVGRLVRVSGQGPVEDEHLVEVPGASRVALLLARFDAVWRPEGRDEKEKKNQTYLSKVTRQLFLPAWALSGIGMFLQQIFQVTIPFLTEEFVLWFSDDSAEQWVGWVLIAGCCGCIVMGSVISSNHAIMQLYILGMDVRSLYNSLVYRKAMRLSHRARGQTTTGQVVTLMSTDCERLPQAILGLHSLWLAPMLLAPVSCILIWKLGVGAVVGLTILAVSLPLPQKIGMAQMKATFAAMHCAEKRAKAVNEGLQGIRVLKFYAWDEAYGGLVKALRNDEVSKLLWMAKLNAVAITQSNIMPILMGIGMLVAFFLIDPSRFTPATVFLALQLMNLIRFPLMMLPMAIKGLAELRATFVRLERFLLLEEVGQNSGMTRLEGTKGRLEIAGGAFEWGPAGAGGLLEGIVSKGKGTGKGKGKGKGKGEGEGEGEPAKDAPGFALRGVALAAHPGRLCAVVGAVGSGKSSLLQAMLGEMPQKEGEITLQGSVAYCAQSPWILNATLRDNVLFNLPLDEEWYEEVLEMCALGPDIEVLPGGDFTEIGEKGITLSGGQKARVALARAVYSRAAVYILDDVLSAVDAETGQILFEGCISRLTSFGAVVVLATNQQHFLPHADVIWVLRDGTVAEQGSYDELRAIPGGALNGTLSSQHLAQEGLGPSAKQLPEVSTPSTAAGAATPTASPSKSTSRTSIARASGSKPVASSSPQGKDALRKAYSLTAAGMIAIDKKVSAGSLTSKEGKREGSVPLRVWRYYFVDCSGGWMVFLAMLGILTASQATKNLMEWWLSYWADAAAEAGDMAPDYHVAVYIALGALLCVGTLARSVFIANLILKSSKVLHERLLWSVLRAPMSFFDTTPVGRVLNRFSKDVDSLDTGLQRCLPIALSFLFDILGLLITIACGMPLFILIAVPLAVCYWDVQRRFRPLARDLQRLESVSRSPIFAQFSETLDGINTIRAYSQSQRFLDTCTARIDTSNRAFFTIHNCNRWLQVRLESISLMLFATVGCFGIQGRAAGTISAGFMALALFYTSTCAGLLNFGLRMFSETEARMTSAERIYEYVTELDTEAALTTDKKLPKGGSGEIIFENVAVRYRPETPLVLKAVSMVVPGGAKVGICGRTGCGKSTLLSVLFRMTDIAENGEGRILLDGVSIVDVGLKDLRQALAIIPQDAVMFAGTLRDNLDLFSEHSDEQLNSAIRQASLEEMVSELPQGLSSTVQEGGENFSCGQRQLVCLARALLRRSRVICLDEATANIDTKTDETIQAVIRQEFQECTVLTIAHRLNTIAHSDKICFLEDGRVAEYDPPAALLARGAGSKFWGLVQEMGEAAAEQLAQDVAAACGVEPPLPPPRGGDQEPLAGAPPGGRAGPAQAACLPPLRGPCAR